jgi:flagellar protein FlbD
VIKVTRLDGSEMTVNSDLVEVVEGTPDTVISLLNGHKLVVREPVEVVIDRVVEYRRRINRCPVIRDRLAIVPVGDPSRHPREEVDQ